MAIRLLDTLFILFFLIHIPITALFASQVVLGPSYASLIPRWARILFESAAHSSKDPLLLMGLKESVREPWMISLFYVELLFQLPLFVYFTIGLFKGTLLNFFYVMNIIDDSSERFKWISVIYSVNVISSMIPILTELYHRSGTQLMATYLPFLVVPLLFLFRALSSTKKATVKRKTK